MYVHTPKTQIPGPWTSWYVPLFFSFQAEHPGPLRRGFYSTPKVCCALCHQDVSSRPFLVREGRFLWTSLVCPSCPTVWFKIWGIWNDGRTVSQQNAAPKNLTAGLPSTNSACGSDRPGRPAPCLHWWAAVAHDPVTGSPLFPAADHCRLGTPHMIVEVLWSSQPAMTNWICTCSNQGQCHGWLVLLCVQYV